LAPFTAIGYDDDGTTVAADMLLLAVCTMSTAKYDLMNVANNILTT
jgi:hypothetical protein